MAQPASRERTAAPPDLDVDAILDREAILVCCGSGGVGKTTTSAALALRAAERGRRVVVLTIDPARRLAQSLGLSALDNEPRLVAGVDSTRGGELYAAMLDMKRTFDDIVLAHNDADRAQAIFDNPFYASLSSSLSGTQEYMAMERLGQLKASGEWDLIVVDTPPTRSALDFLDAPQRLSRFLDGRLLSLLLAPARTGGRAYLKVLSVGVGLVTSVLSKVLGAEYLRDISAFVGAMETMFGGFRARAQLTYDLLKAADTAFVVVAAPESDALREAAYFVERLAAESMPLAGLVVNRVHRSTSAALTARRCVVAAEDLEARGEDLWAAAVLRVHADRVAMLTREKRLQQRFSEAHPAVAIAEVAAQDGDVHDLEGLRRVGADLAQTGITPGAAAAPPRAPSAAGPRSGGRPSRPGPR